MSLILEALKKLDREKQAPDRGLLVVGPAEWPTAPDSRPGVRVAAAIALALLAVGAALWVYGGRPSTVERRDMPPREVATREVAPGDTGPRDAAGRHVSPRDAAPRADRSTNAAPSAAAPRAAALPALREAPPRAPAAERAAAAEPEPSLDEPRPDAAPDSGARIKEPKRAAGVYQLQAISAQEGHPVAILNDRLVREGDSFDGVRVVRIGADEVEIEVAGRRRVLKF